MAPRGIATAVAMVVVGRLGAAAGISIADTKYGGRLPMSLAWRRVSLENSKKGLTIAVI